MVTNLPNFVLIANKLDIVYSYKYLGVHFYYNGKFTVAKNDLCCKGTRVVRQLRERMGTCRIKEVRSS